MLLFSSYFFTNISLAVLIKKSALALRQSYRFQCFPFRLSEREILQVLQVFRATILRSSGSFAKPINLNIAKQLKKRWNFSHCFGAMEGKQAAIKKCDGSSRFLIQEYLFDLFISCC